MSNIFAYYMLNIFVYHLILIRFLNNNTIPSCIIHFNNRMKNMRKYVFMIFFMFSSPFHQYYIIDALPLPYMHGKVLKSMITRPLSSLHLTQSCNTDNQLLYYQIICVGVDGLCTTLSSGYVMYIHIFQIFFCVRCVSCLLHFSPSLVFPYNIISVKGIQFSQKLHEQCLKGTYMYNIYLYVYKKKIIHPKFLNCYI